MTQEPTIMYCVGATKAGTSWLYDYLADHSACHLRSIKELHYFDTIETGRFRYQMAVQRRQAARLRERLWVAKSHDLHRATSKMRDVLDWHTVLGERVENPASYLAYLNHGRKDEKLVADITPAYALLPERRLRQMAHLSRNTRFVYLMRDPVARLWSHVRMIARRAQTDRQDLAVTCHRIMDRVLSGQRSSLTERGDYAGAITRLNAAVDPKKLLIMFMEEMLTQAGLGRLCAFLGIDDKPARFDQPVHVGPAVTMRQDQRARAAVLLRPQYDFVARRFPDIPANWRSNMGEGRL